jgi:transposase
MSIMENVERKKQRPRRSFTAEFKAEIVECCQRGDRSIGQVARDFDLTETAVREWVRQAERDAGTRSDGLASSEREELAQLRRENRRLREDVEILRRATAFFAKETRGTCIRSSRRRKLSSATSSGRVSCCRSPVPPTTPTATGSPRAASRTTPS